MNTTALQEYFWGGTEPYVPTTLEYYLFIISNITWCFVACTYYAFSRHHTARWCPTYSFMVKDYPANYSHRIMWICGFLLRLLSIIWRRQGKGLTILLPIIVFFWTGTSFIPVKDDGIQYNKDTRYHNWSALGLFGSVYILSGFFCTHYLLFQLKFALLILSIYIPYNKHVLFSIMEHICVHHVCVYSYPLI